VATDLEASEKVLLAHRNLIGLYVEDNKSKPCKMLKKSVQQGRSE
jgi:hypothetical protein